MSGNYSCTSTKDFDASILANFHDKDSWDVSVAERSFIKALNGGCSSPSAAYGVIQGEKIVLTGFYVDKTAKFIK